jgi:hypothetical protein
MRERSGTGGAVAPESPKSRRREELGLLSCTIFSIFQTRLFILEGCRATLSCVVLPAGVLALVAPSAGGSCGASWLSASTSGLASSTRRSGEHDFGFGVLRVKTLHRCR